MFLLGQSTEFVWREIANQGLLGIVLIAGGLIAWRFIKLWLDEKIVDGKKYLRRLDENQELRAENRRLHDMMEETVAPTLERMVDILDRIERHTWRDK